jgi:hypothetical protein
MPEVRIKGNIRFDIWLFPQQRIIFKPKAQQIYPFAEIYLRVCTGEI